MVIAGPGVPADQVRYDPITTANLTPTILDLAHARRYLGHGCDSASLLPVIEHGDRGWPAPVVTEGWLSVPGLVAASGRAFGYDLTTIGLRTARYSYIRYSDGQQELYDLRRDPNEFHSVARLPRYAGLLAQMRRLWWRYKDCAGAECRDALPANLRASPAAERLLSTIYWSGVHAEYGTHRGDRL
jgi:arylsulfatase A-like enzyme